MVILGIDPGTAITGYGVVRRDSPNRFSVLGYGVIITPSNQEMAGRLKTIYGEVCRLIEEFHPDCLAIEQLFFNTNVTTAITVGQARGVAILAGAHSGLPIAEYTPLQVKQAVTGNGRAAKEQVGYMVKVLLGLDDIPRPDDVADALAICLCHGYNCRKWGDMHDCNAHR